MAQTSGEGCCSISTVVSVFRSPLLISKRIWTAYPFHPVQILLCYIPGTLRFPFFSNM